MISQAHTRRSLQITEKRPHKFHSKISRKKRTSMPRAISVELSPNKELLSNEMIEKVKLRDTKQVTEHSKENNIDVFINSAIFLNRKEYILCCFI